MPQESRRPALLLGLCAAAVVTLPPLAAGQTYIYNGPFTGTGNTVNFWSADSWIGGTPTSSATTQLVFRNFDANQYSANNDLGNPFQLNSVLLQSFSTSSTTVSSTTGYSLQLTGANPTVTPSGPGTVSFATGGNGLVLNPTSGTTTFGGGGDGLVTIGNAGITGTGGLVLNNTGLGGVTMFGANTFTGGATLNSGILNVGAAGALGTGNTLTVNGGVLRGNGAAIANAVVANANFAFNSGTLTINGPVSGAGGVQLVNGAVFSSQGLTLGGALSYAGATSVGGSFPRPSGSATNLATLTLAATATLNNSQPITVGNNATLALAGNATNTRVPNQNALVLDGGRVAFTGSTTTETFGNVSASGLSVFTLAAGATNSTLAFGAFNRTDNATLNVRGPLAGSAGSSSKLTFSGGLPAIADPLAPSNTGQYVGVVPFAAGTNVATAVNVGALVTYDATAGTRYLGPANAANFQQVAAGGTFDANTQFKNANIAGNSATVTDAERVNSLAATTASVVTGGGTLTVFSGAVLVATGNGGGLVLSGPTLDFGANPGYLHLGGNLSLQGTSALTGSAGVVVSGLDQPGSATANGGGGGYRVQFSNGANPFTGGLTVNGNALVAFTADAQLGAAGGGITLGGGGLTFNSATATAITVSRPVTLGAAGGNLATLPNTVLTVAGAVSGPGGLSIGSGDGAVTGVVALTNANSYTGPTYLLNNATLRIASDANVGGAAQPLNVLGGTLQFGASATFSKPVYFAAVANLDTNGNAVTLAGPLSGLVPTGINKVGAGTLTLAASSPLYDGAFFVNAGTLNLAAANTLPQVTTLVVNSGGTLAGNGAVGGSVSVAAGGTLAPGNSAGRISVGNTVTFAANSVAFMELGGATSADYDQLLVGGALNLNGTLTLSLLNNFVPTLNEKFYLFDDLGLLSPTGTFANGTGAGNLLFTDNAGNTYQINYADHDPADLSNALNNDVSLTVVGLAVVPEPSTWALLLAAGVGGLLTRAVRPRRSVA